MCSIVVSFIKEENMTGLNGYGLISLLSVVYRSLTKDAGTFWPLAKEVIKIQK